MVQLIKLFFILSSNSIDKILFCFIESHSTLKSLRGKNSLIAKHKNINRVFINIYSYLQFNFYVIRCYQFRKLFVFLFPFYYFFCVCCLVAGDVTYSFKRKFFYSAPYENINFAHKEIFFISLISYLRRFINLLLMKFTICFCFKI